MIPKKIHYCWFGGKQLPDEAKRFIDSWKRYCPDYEIIEWNENNFDLNKCAYIKEAYEAKKWAFITDYVRLYVMVNYGGIYMDTDVEVIKSLDPFLKHQAFSGFEDKENIPTGIMACEKGFPLFAEFLNYYNDSHFVKEDGTYDITTNVKIITEMCHKYKFIPNNEYQVINGFALYPNDYFCPKSHETGIINMTENTVTIHHFAGSWLTKHRKTANNIQIYFRAKNMQKLGVLISFPWTFADKVKNKGMTKTLKYYFRKYILRKEGKQ